MVAQLLNLQDAASKPPDEFLRTEQAAEATELLKNQPPEAACVKLAGLVFRQRNNPAVGVPDNDLRSSYDPCIQSKCFLDLGMLSTYQSVGLATCGQLGLTKDCRWQPGNLMQPKTAPPPLPPWRIGVGIGAIVVGGVMLAIGAAHLATPVFKTSGGCNALGVDSECAVNRLGLGVPLVIIGALGAGVGGGLTLGLRR